MRARVTGESEALEAQLIELQATAARDAARHESSLGLLQSHAASLETLHDKISDAKVRKKPDKLVLTLSKETAYSWHDLKK